MKLVTLNTWGGRIREPLLYFLKKYQNNIDVFCFQEIYHDAQGKEEVYIDDAPNLFSDIRAVLNNYESYFHPAIKDFFGLALFFKKEISAKEVGELFVHKTPEERFLYKKEDHGHHPRNIQFLKIVSDAHNVTIVNVHGLWNGQGKKDSPERIEQSKRIKEFLDSQDGEKILCGDFNLEPETESMKMLEENMRNLVKVYGVTDTRTKLYTKEVRFADYILVSQGIKVKEFKVLPDEVSDHAPLYLEFDVE